jgi:hypothetical protein
MYGGPPWYEVGRGKLYGIKMESVICTLFEGDYHFGLAGLVNSLVQVGFKGTVWAGYRGDIPGWAAGADENSPWVVMGTGCSIRFRRLQTKAHFTNCKPEVMLGILEDSEYARAERLFYFDPDIVVQGRWPFFEEWADAGVALSEDVNSPLPENHPRRVAWRQYFESEGLHLAYRQPAYVNGGFVGVRRDRRAFLNCWLETQGLVSRWVGGSDKAKVLGGVPFSDDADPNAPFSSTDQDALNAATECCPEIPLSIIGKEGMGFKPGGHIMHHALGPRKPWRRRYLKEALSGCAPAMVDKLFWQLMKAGPLKPVSIGRLRWKMLEVSIASALGRFIRRT